MNPVLQLFTAIEASAPGAALRNSYWLFPAIESFHLLGLAVMGGAVLVVDLRMLGFGLTRTPINTLSRDTRPYLLGSLALMLISGYLLFASEATKCYEHGAFWVKMACLLAATIFTLTVKARVARHEDGKVSPAMLKAVAIISLALWTGVGIGGRWIGFS